MDVIKKTYFTMLISSLIGVLVLYLLSLFKSGFDIFYSMIFIRYFGLATVVYSIICILIITNKLKVVNSSKIVSFLSFYLAHIVLVTYLIQKNGLSVKQETIAIIITYIVSTTIGFIYYKKNVAQLAV